MIRFLLFVLLFALIFAELNYAAQNTLINDSTVITGCWISQLSKSEESVYDSLYNTDYYYVQFYMCLDEYFNIEINKKIKYDCCNEDNKNFRGTYQLQSNKLIIRLDEFKISESYSYRIESNTLYLKPINDDKNDAGSIMLKYKWLKY